ncbi:hypothetical protein EON62_02100, partial [archaeon]
MDGRSSINYSRPDCLAEIQRGRNAIYIGYSNRIVRLQPIPVHVQVQHMLQKGQVAAASALIKTSAPSEEHAAAMMRRLHADAARMHFLKADFAVALPHLVASDIDPREIVAMFPELFVSEVGVDAMVLKADSMTSTRNLGLLARAYRMPPHYFAPDVLSELASNKRTVASTVGESADARQLPVPLTNSELVNDARTALRIGRDSKTLARHDAPGVTARLPPFSAILPAQIIEVLQRAEQEDKKMGASSRAAEV